MTDDEAREFLPAVDEFVGAVSDRDEALMWACFELTDPHTLAILCAELLRDTRQRLSRAQRVLHATRDINPAGVTRERAWEIALLADERRAA